jgi:hypothetical protein
MNLVISSLVYAIATWYLPNVRHRRGKVELQGEEVRGKYYSSGNEWH